MRRLNIAMLAIAHLILFALLCVMSAQAAGGEQDFLRVDQAFQPASQRVDDSHVAVTWQIADGYYLYRHAFGFKFVGDVQTGTPDIPDGKKHNDEYFGEVETYRDHLRVVVPTADGATLANGARIQVQYQGCADAGLCYPPQTKTLTLAGANTDRGSGPPSASGPGGSPGAGTQAPTADGGPVTTASAAPDTTELAEQDSLAQRLAEGSPIVTLALFFGLGILLAFTPCILPMIPILSGLIVGSGAKSSRAFVLSLAYVIAMALAYTVFGVIAGYFGANIQAALQMPWVLLPFAAVFVGLALASFGVFEIQVPSAWQQRLGQVGTRRGDIVGAALMGFFSALIAGPCLAPPLVGALLYISSSGDMLTGGAALFMLGLGMGVPLLIIGTFGSSMLPRAGAWMSEIRYFFGVLLLGVAWWLATRLLDPVTALAGWGVLALGYGAYLSARDTARAETLAIKRAAVFLLLAYAGAAIVGVFAGQGRPTQPLTVLSGSRIANAGTGATAGQRPSSPVFTRVKDLDALHDQLAQAKQAGRVAIVDFYADWCVECVRMEHTVFAEPRVREALKNISALQVDVTDYDGADRTLMRQFGVFGPPAILFYGSDGTEAKSVRLIGYADADGFLDRLRHAGGAGQTAS